MRPIVHGRHRSSRAASSRHAVDAVVVGIPVPLGIPALFLADQLSRGRAGEQILSGKRGLIAEYAGAEGYAYAWGHLIEQRLGRFVLWRVVPVALWERLSDVRAGSPLLIEELLTLVQRDVHPALASHLPVGVLLTGFQGASRRSRHALFALVLADPRGATAVRRWLAMSEFIQTDHLTTLPLLTTNLSSMPDSCRSALRGIGKRKAGQRLAELSSGKKAPRRET